MAVSTGEKRNHQPSHEVHLRRSARQLQPIIFPPPDRPSLRSALLYSTGEIGECSLEKPIMTVPKRKARTIGNFQTRERRYL